MTRKTTTSSEVKQRWEAAAYKKYIVRLRVEDDSEIIDYIEKHKEIGTTELFRRAIEELMSKG